MRVEFQTREGFVGVSPASAPVTIDLAALKAEERQGLETFVRRARFFELPATVPAPLGPDPRVCRIRIEDEGREHTVNVSCRVPGPALQRLIDRLVRIEAAAIRHRRGRSRI